MLRPRTALPAAAASLALAAQMGGCGRERPTASRAAPAVTATTAPARRAADQAAVRRAHCPANAANCAAVTGRVLYVEAVDPDGDGDAHYVLLGGAVTAPGVTIIDVGLTLRPRR